MGVGSRAGIRGKKDKAAAATGSASPARSPGLAARRAAAAILRKVIEGRVPLDPLIDEAAGHKGFRSLAARDRGLVRAILNAALRHRGEIERAVARCLERPLKEDAGALSAILHVGAAQLLYLQVPDHAAVDLAVAACRTDRRTGQAAGLVNSVLRRIARERHDFLNAPVAARLNTPDWLFDRWTETYGDDQAAAIAAMHAKKPPLDLTARGDPQRVADEVGGVLLPTGSVRLAGQANVPDLPGFRAGDWWVQDAAAALPSRLLGDVAGRRVADLCAAPGGKTAQLAAGGGRVTAVDLSPGRMKRLQSNLNRLRLHADLVTADILAWTPAERFDAILLDAPCLATGTIRRHPDIPWTKRPADIEALTALQARMLRRAADWLAPGGALVYCTCSLEPEECERQVAAFLGAAPGFRRDPVRPDEVAGLAHLIGTSGDLRTLPSHAVRPDGIGAGAARAPVGAAGLSAGMDGFFAARICRA